MNWWESAKDIGSIAGILAFARLLIKDVTVFFIKPKLEIFFDPVEDIKTWSFRDAPFKRKVCTVHIKNSGRTLAERCEAHLEIKELNPKINLSQKEFYLHWADTDYKNFSASMEPVDINRFNRRRLDLVFTQEGQNMAGCWIASSQSLASGPERNQFFLPPSNYKIKISVVCKNGKGSSKEFELFSPENWVGLKIEPLK